MPKPDKARRGPSRSKKTTTVRKGRQWPHETPHEALRNWNLAVESWGARPIEGFEVIP